MSDTTNISLLPTPNQPSMQQNITLSTNDINQPQPQPQSQPQTQPQQMQPPPEIQMTQSQMNEINNNILQAASSGSTQIPSRDIPTDTHSVVADPGITPNYLPKDNNDYIGDYDSEQNVLNNYNKRENVNSLLDSFFIEFQVPIILIVLFFLFQLPFLNRSLMGVVPKLFADEGNLNFYGMLFKSILYGLVYYVITKFSDKLVNI